MVRSRTDANRLQLQRKQQCSITIVPASIDISKLDCPGCLIGSVTYCLSYQYTIELKWSPAEGLGDSKSPASLAFKRQYAGTTVVFSISQDSGDTLQQQFNCTSTNVKVAVEKVGTRYDVVCAPPNKST